MEISLTKLPWFRNVRVTAFDSNDKVCWPARQSPGLTCPRNGLSVLTAMGRHHGHSLVVQSTWRWSLLQACIAPATYPLRSPSCCTAAYCLPSRLPSLDGQQPGLQPLGRAVQVKNDILTSSCAVPIPPIWSQEHKAWCMDGCFSDFDLIKVRLWTSGDALL